MPMLTPDRWLADFEAVDTSSLMLNVNSMRVKPAE